MRYSSLLEVGRDSVVVRLNGTLVTTRTSDPRIVDELKAVKFGKTVDTVAATVVQSTGLK